VSLKVEDVRSYWDKRAKSDATAQSTTQDYYMREIELRSLTEVLATFKPSSVLDVGCGDARTTCALARQFPEMTFRGVDYAESMIENANRVIHKTGVKNVRTSVCDITAPLGLPAVVDLIYTTRCLINITDVDLQQAAIQNIYTQLAPGGIYTMIENFIEGHNNLNGIRKLFGLPEIYVRDHNLFFDHQGLSKYIQGKFNIIEELNISSTYYLSSRVIYSKICQDSGVAPDYFDPHHQYGAMLPFSGEYGPVRMIIMRRI
jgi:ubiquinone/menaquinone biosynthesis C-methylase UbiE